MGDVIGINDCTGDSLVIYLYDEWGKVTEICPTLSGTQAEFQYALGEANPLRYRGYYYDNETGYYYLQSRYYDPSICRFINSDLVIIAKQQKHYNLMTNIYLYCRNSPINYCDANGKYSYRITSMTFKPYMDAWIALYYDGSFITYGYITFSKRGFACFDNTTYEAYQIYNYLLFDDLAASLKEASKRFKSNPLSSRTIKGLTVELIVHYLLYKMNYKTYRTNVTDMGGVNNDPNAATFEAFALNSYAFKVITSKNTSKIKQYLNRFKNLI